MIYLIHFARPLHHARHYLGYATDVAALPARVERHAAGRGSKLMAAVAAAGIPFEVVRTWPDGTRDDERRLKNQNHGPRLCPICNAARAA